MLHEQECRLLDSGALPFAPLNHDGHRVEVLLLGPGDDLHVVLVHDGPHVRAVCVGSRLDKYKCYRHMKLRHDDITWKLGMIGRSKLNNSGVSSLTLALALSTPPISPAMDT